MRRLALAALVGATACGQEGNVEAPLGPIGRVMNLNAPADLSEARGMGCLVVGDRLGTGFGGLELVAGEFEQYFQPRDGGLIDIVTLVEARRFSKEGETFDLRFWEGKQKTRTTFAVGDAYFEFQDLTRDDEGWVEGTTPSFFLDLPVLGDLLVEVEITAAGLTGEVRVEDGGLILEDALLSGYVRDETVLHLIDEVIAACPEDKVTTEIRGDRPRVVAVDPSLPTICETLFGAFGPDLPAARDDVYDQFYGLVGGFDAAITDGRPKPCVEAEGTCNAASVCVQVSVEPTEIEPT